MTKTKTAAAALALCAAAGLAAATATHASGTRGAAAAKSCSFDLRIGDVLPSPGDLAAYGANLDRAVKLAVGLQTAALKSAGAKTASVSLVASEDGQTQA